MTTIPAYTISGLTRPELFLDPNGNIVLTPDAQAFANQYGLKALYLGCPPGTPWPPVTGLLLTTPVDTNAAANSIAEGAAVNTPVGITAEAHDIVGFPITYSLTNSANGAFKINSTTGVVTVADPTKIDFETAPGHSYSITVQATDGIFSSSQTFTIGVTDIAPSTPTDSNAAANAVTEGAAAGTAVGITAASTDVNGPNVTWSLSADSSGGGFAINATTGVITVADPSKIDFEASGPGHTYTVTARASDGTLSSSQTFTIAVTDVTIGTPVDSNAAANRVAEGAAVNTLVGVTASAVDPNGPATTYSLIGDTSGGGFKIDATTGVVSVADPTKIDFEGSGPGHSYNITVQAVNGATTTSQTFTIAVTDVAPSTPVDSDAASNTIAEGAANGSTVGVTASATDVNGAALTYSLVGDSSNGGFTINPTTGVITVADSTKIDYETAPGHAYTVTAQASDGTLTSSQSFTIGVTDVAPSAPVDGNAAANTVAEGAAAGSTVGVTASASDLNGGTLTYSLTGDSSGGGFTINSTTGVVTVADPTKIDYETAPGHAYTVTAQASEGTLTSSQSFTIGVTDVAPSAPVDGNAAANTVAEGAANGSTVGLTAASFDVNGPAVTYSLIGDSSGGGFTINSTTGVVTVADASKIDFESSGGSYTVTAQASDGTVTSSQAFVIGVTDVAPSTPVDSDGAINRVAVGAPVGAATGVTASSTDVNGPAVTYSLVGDTSGGAFTINAATGKVTVADPSKILAADPSYDVTVASSDGTLHSQQTFTIAVVLDAAPDVTAGHTLNYTENQAATVIDPALTVTDSDDANLVSAKVQITGNYVNGQDVLGFTNQNGITGSFDAATGTLALTGSSSVANYQAALASVTYFNTSDNPSGLARTVTITANDGTLDSAPVTDTINVTPVNDAPTVVAGHTLNYTENQAATAFDPAITVTDADNANLASATVQITGNYVSGQDVLAFTAQNGITGSFNAGTGTLTLTGSSSVANYQAALASVTYVNTSENPSGLDRTVTIIANDGTANSAAVSDTIHVTPVNDAPVTTAGGTLNYTENDAATAINPTVNVSDVDSANMSSATVQITGNYVNGQDILGFTNQNGITGSFNAGTGSLTLTGSSSVANYKAALDSVTYFNSSDNPSGLDRTVSYTVNDGSANSNTSTSTIHVTPVNDAPVVNATGTLNFTENQAATAIAPALTVTDADTATLTTATVQISANYVNGEDLLGFTNTANITGSFNAATGTLTLTGTDTVANYQAALRSVTYTDNSENPSTLARTVTFTADDGQAANHLSAGSNHTINVTSVDDAPTASVPTDASIGTAFSHTDLAISGLSVGDIDAGSGNVTATISAANASLSFNTAGLASFTNNSSHTVTLTGTVAQVNAALATLKYNSDDGFTGSDTVTLSVNDNGNTGTGGPLSSGNQTFHVGVVPQVFIVDNTGGGSGGSGTAADPFKTIADFNTNAADGSGDYIYIKHGTGTYSEADGINLLANEHLYGQGQTLQFTNPVTGEVVTIGTGSAGNTPTISVTGANQHGIDLAANDQVTGLNVATTLSSQTGVFDSGASVGNLTMNDIDVTGSGQAVNITHGGALTVTIDTLSSSGGAYGVQLGGALTGSFTGTAGTLSGHTTAEFDVNGGTGNISYGGAINDGTGLSASVANHTGGTVAFSGAISDGADTGGGVTLSSNTGGTVNFTGGMTLTTGASSGFSATGGGTVNVTGTNHVTTTTGTALNITNTTIGASNVTFHDISANGAVNGIVLNNTGTSGHLTVTGTGTTDGSGGTIQNTTGDAVSLTSTQDVSLSNMNIQNGAGNGILGNTVNGLVLSNDTVSGNGNSTTGDGEGNIYLYELTGSASHLTTFDNLTVSNSYVHNVFIKNTGGTLADLVVTNSTFSNDGASTHAGDEFQIDLTTGGIAGTPTATVHATHNTFSGNLSTPANFTATGFAGSVDEGTLNVHLGDGTAGGLNTFDTNNSGITLTQTGSASLNFDVNDNIVTHNRAVGVAINHFDTGIVTGFLRNTTIGTQGDLHSGAEIGNGVDIHDESVSGSMTLSVTNSVVQSVGDGAGSGFEGILVQSGNGAQNSASTINLTLTGNTIRDILDDRGLFINDFNIAGASTINALVSGNTFINANGSGATTTARIGGAPGGTDHVNVTQADANALAAANGLTASAAPGSTMRVDTNVFFNHAAPPTPPATPQMALHGQGPGGADQLTMDALAPVLAAAIQHWADAGASAAQIALLGHASLKIADLPNSGFLADTDASGITIDTDGAGWGWFIDPTPSDNSEFHATASPSELIATSGNAANHIDLLTVVEHELGHILGLPDTGQTGVMNIALDSGERRLPDAADVAGAPAVIQQTQPQQNTPAPAPIASTAPADSVGGFTSEASHGNNFGFGGGIAQNFAFAQFNPTAPTLLPGALANFFKGDGFNFSAFISQFHTAGVTDAMPIHASDIGLNFAASGVGGGQAFAQYVDAAHSGGHADGWLASYLEQFHFGLLT